MPLLVQFGAGAIGRGFIAPLASHAGWEVLLVDADATLVQSITRDGGYTITEVDGRGETVIRIRGVRACLPDDPAVDAALLTCDLAATSVGLARLATVGRRLGPVALRRATPLDVLVCENGAQAHLVLAEAAAPARLGCVRTSIGRMAPPAVDGALRVEPYHALPVDRSAFLGPVPNIPGLQPEDDFDLVIARKLYLHNLTHAALAYGGARRGHGTIAEAVADPLLAGRARAAGEEAARAIAVRFGAQTAAATLALLDDLFRRYANPGLADPVTRVGRDPWRKLAPDDRLLGAWALCRAAGLPAPAIAAAIADALVWRCADDEPGAAEWNALTPVGRAKTANLPPELTMDRRHTAAATLAEAGIVLRPAEVEAIETAEFGLGRFNEIGLAIVVYVNTDRCCAKELVMLPNQICPEHRHPDVDGRPGKEETFRVRSGRVHLFLPGPHATAHGAPAEVVARAQSFWPADKRTTITVYREVVLNPGDQYTLAPNTPHWFAAGPQGAVVSEFSTRSLDEADIFTDPAIRRVEAA